jgi:putative transposase
MTKRKVAQPDLIDLLLADYQKQEDLIGENGILKQLTKAIVERALQAELAAHPGHDKHEAVANESGNTRNGSSAKTLKGDFGALPIDIPRDRDGSFEPQLIDKHQTRWTGFDDKILSLYARGMTVREIQSHLEEMYGTEVSPTLISSVTDAVMDEVKAWQARPLDALYPIVYLDCIHAKVRDGGAVRVKAVYLALGVNLNGDKELLGLWVAQNEGAKFWLQVATELKNRGCRTSSSPAWMASRALLKPLKRCSRRRRDSCASCRRRRQVVRSSAACPVRACWRTYRSASLPTTCRCTANR